MDTEQRLNLVTRNTAEVLTPTEIRKILETRTRPKAYIGFEPSGLMHIGIGLVCARKIRDFVEAGFDFTVFLADWHAWINNKLGGEMQNIRTCGEYFRHCFTGIGIDPGKVRYVWASELAEHIEYWEKVIRIGKSNSLTRVRRALPILGRGMEGDDVEAAALFYPCLQAADILQMELDVAYAGMDQRKAHILAREAAERLGFKKPAAVHTPLLMGLSAGKGRMGTGMFDENPELDAQIEFKMSKSIPESEVIVHDEPSMIRDKLRGAYCPQGEVEMNPVLEIAKVIIFPERGRMQIAMPKKPEKSRSYEHYVDLESDYRKGEIHPLDLKNSVAEELIGLLEGVRKVFSANPEPLRRMLSIEVTR